MKNARKRSFDRPPSDESTESAKKLLNASKIGVGISGCEFKVQVRAQDMSKSVCKTLAIANREKVPQRYWDNLFDDAFKAIDDILFDKFFETKET
jgi:hypothetical protein